MRYLKPSRVLSSYFDELKMKLTESQLRNVIHQVLIEDASGPSALKKASSDVIMAINEENPAAFWNAFSEIIEGLAGTVSHAPGADNLERKKFIEAIKPVWRLTRQLAQINRTSAK